MTNPAESPSTRTTDDEPDTTPDDGGQVSEVASFGEPGKQVSPEDSVAGAPDGENGRAYEGPTGPDAVTNEKRQDHHPAQNNVETTG